jgi:hypothetical protein
LQYPISREKIRAWWYTLIISTGNVKYEDHSPDQPGHKVRPFPKQPEQKGLAV